MDFLERFKARRESRRHIPLKEWFFVTFNDFEVMVQAKPPGRASWERSFPWSSVLRVCFKDEGLTASDGIYVFTSLRAESFTIPTEASGGSEFFDQLVSRGLFPGEIASQAITSTDGGLYCWPPLEQSVETHNS